MYRYRIVIFFVGIFLIKNRLNLLAAKSNVRFSYEDWELLSRRILGNPKHKVYKLGKIELKLFLKIFLSDDEFVTSITSSIQKLKMDLLTASPSKNYHNSNHNYSPADDIFTNLMTKGTHADASGTMKVYHSDTKSASNNNPENPYVYFNNDNHVIYQHNSEKYDHYHSNNTNQNSTIIIISKNEDISPDRGADTKNEMTQTEVNPSQLEKSSSMKICVNDIGISDMDLGRQIQPESVVSRDTLPLVSPQSNLVGMVGHETGMYDYLVKNNLSGYNL